MKELPIIVITGPDGSGKSTACAAVRAELEKKLGQGQVLCANIWDSVTASGFLTQEAVVGYLSRLQGVARTLFLFHAMRNSLDLALAKSPRVVLADGYFYKYAVSELTYGVSTEIVRGAALGFALPRLTFFLDVDAKTALARKPELSRYESGAETATDQAQKFLKFQGKMQAHWQALESEYGPWVHVPTAAGVEDVTKRLLAEIGKVGL